MSESGQTRFTAATPIATDWSCHGPRPDSARYAASVAVERSSIRARPLGAWTAHGYDRSLGEACGTGVEAGSGPVGVGWRVGSTAGALLSAGFGALSNSSCALRVGRVSASRPPRTPPPSLHKQ